MKQFYMLDADFKGEKILTHSAILAYTFITDRMRSSIKRPEFFDAKRNAYYVIYTVRELMHDLDSESEKVVNILKQLEEEGYIVKVLPHKGAATRIFIPNHESFSLPNADKDNDLNSIEEDISSTDIKENKNVRENKENPIANEEENYQELESEKANKSTVSKIKTEPFRKSKTNQRTNHNKQINTEINTENGQKTRERKQADASSISFESWIESTSRGYCMDVIVPQTVAKYARYFENPKALAGLIIGTISKVRGFIAKKYDIAHSELSQFDSNANLGKKLADNIQSVMVHIIGKGMTEVDQILKYLNKSMQNFFTNATGKAIKIAQPMFAPKMDVDNRQSKTLKQQREVQLPQWFKDKKNGNEEKIEKPLVFDVLKIKAMLLKFDDNVERDYDNVIFPQIKKLMSSHGIGLKDQSTDDENSSLYKSIKSIEAEIVKM